MPPCNNKHYICSGSMVSCNKNEICIKKRQQHVVESVNKNVILRQRSLQCLFIMYKQLLLAPHINLIRYYVCNAVPFGWTSKIGRSFIAKTSWNFYNSFSLATIFKTQEKTQDLFFTILCYILHYANVQDNNYLFCHCNVDSKTTEFKRGLNLVKIRPARKLFC